MKVIEIAERFGVDRLRLTERPEIAPGKGQISIRMRAASLNYRDWLMVEGKYNPRQPLPLIPGSDGVGIVDAVGEAVERFQIGDRVLPTFAQGWIDGPPEKTTLRATLGGPLDGVLCEQMVIDAEGAVAAPSYLSDVEAATLPCAAVTAWNALVVHGELQAGERVVVQGTGGVAIFALQMATAMGAEVIALTSRDERRDRLRELGAVEVINYREDPEWGRTVRKQFGGAQLVVDVGGAATLPQSLAAMTIGGRICQVGNLGGGRVEVDLISLFMQQVRLQGILVGHRASFEAMNQFLETHQLRPLVDRTLPLDQTADALTQLAAGEQFGKICIRISESSS